MADKKIKRIVGDILKITLEDGSICFGRVLDEPLIAFYDAKKTYLPTNEEIVQFPILFKVWVMNHAITSGRWKIIGHKKLDDSLKKPVTFFKQDPLSKDFFLYVNSQEILTTRKQCKGLERAAVWDPEHVEDRLRDYYLDVHNKWVKSLQPNHPE